LFTLGWMGRLTPDQLEFVGQLVRHRGNLQKLAAELQIAYNTARNRMDEIVTALEGSSATATAHGASQRSLTGWPQARSAMKKPPGCWTTDGMP
jgi:hypothetical protein